MTGFIRKCWNSKSIPLKDELTLSTWQKWVRYHRFPWKMLIDGVTAVVCIVLVLLISAQSSSYSLNMNSSLNQIFNPSSSPTAQTSIATLYDTQSFVQALSMFVNNYWTLPNVTLSRFGRFRDVHGKILEPVLTLQRFNESFYNTQTGTFEVKSLQTTTTTYRLSLEDPLGPFTFGTSSEVDQVLLQSTVYCSISVEFQSLNVGLMGALPYRWSVVGEYSFVPGAGTCNFRLSTGKRLNTGTLGTIDFGVQIGLSVFLLLWSIGSVVLSVRALLRGWRHYSLVKRLFQELPENVIGKYTPHYSDWKSLPFSLKRKFASFWNLWNLVGNVLLIIASVLCFMIYGSDNVDLDMAYIVALGLGTFFTLINLTRYFELFRHFSVLINTLRVSFRRVIALLVSVMPVFFAFVLLGLAIFSNFSQRFSSLDQVAVALFCIANGDELHATFEELRLTFPWQIIAQIYLYLFLALFIFAVLNILVFVVDDAFEAAKNWDRKAWKERQTFTLANLIAILELEGKELKDLPSANADWQLLNFDEHDRSKLTEVSPLIQKDSSDKGDAAPPVSDSSLPVSPSSIRMSNVTSDDLSSSEAMPPLERSITKAIQLERRRQQAVSPAKKEKEEVDLNMGGEEKSEIDKVLDAAFESMQQDLKNKFDSLRETLKKSQKRRGRRVGKVNE